MSSCRLVPFFTGSQRRIQYSRQCPSFFQPCHQQACVGGIQFLTLLLLKKLICRWWMLAEVPLARKSMNESFIQSPPTQEQMLSLQPVHYHQTPRSMYIVIIIKTPRLYIFGTSAVCTSTTHCTHSLALTYLKTLVIKKIVVTTRSLPCRNKKRLFASIYSILHKQLPHARSIFNCISRRSSWIPTFCYATSILQLQRQDAILPTAISNRHLRNL
jgi:hypothetical protein